MIASLKILLAMTYDLQVKGSPLSCLFLKRRNPYWLCYLTTALLPVVCLAADKKKGYPAYPSKEKQEETYWPEYTGCQDMPDSFLAKEPPPPETKTEAAACGFSLSKVFKSLIVVFRISYQSP